MSPDRIRSWLAEQWAAGLRTILAGVMPEEPRVTAELPPPDQVPVVSLREPFWLSQTLSVLSRPAIWVGAETQAWTLLGRRVLAALGVEEPGPDEIQESYRDLIAQANAAVVQRIAEVFRFPVNCAGVVPADKSNGAYTATVNVALNAADPPIALVLSLTEALLQRLADVPGHGAAAGERQRAVVPEAVAALVLPVHVILGRTSLTLREILQFAVGSVIELPTMVADPVAIEVNSRLIARGQVVATNNIYGVSITECRWDASENASC